MNPNPQRGPGLGIGLAATTLVLHACAGSPHGCDPGHDLHRGDPMPHHEAAMEHDDPSFAAQHIQEQRTITLHGPLATVWPLFDPINESKWAPQWQPRILHPTDGTVTEGMVMRTHGMKVDRGELTWTVARYDTEQHHVTYAVTNPERTFTVDVQCVAHGESLTRATITYSFVGLTEFGNEVSRHAAEHMFREDLRDWQRAINHYLETGTALPHDEHH